MARRCRPWSPSSSCAALTVATLLLSCCFHRSLCHERGGSEPRGRVRDRRLLLPAPPAASSSSPTTTTTRMENIPRTSRRPDKQEHVSFKRIPPSASNPTQNKSKPRNDGPGNQRIHFTGRRW